MYKNSSPGLHILSILLAVSGTICTTAAFARVSGKPTVIGSKDLMHSVASQGSLTILLSALKQTGLDKTLMTKGPFTLFAPDNAAFGKLPKTLWPKLLQDKKKLRLVLLYHVVPQGLTKADIKYGAIKTLSGDYLMANVTAGSGSFQMVDGAVVTKPEISCSNGVIHIIDTVLIPRTGVEDLADASKTSVSSTPIR